MYQQRRTKGMSKDARISGRDHFHYYGDISLYTSLIDRSYEDSVNPKCLQIQISIST